MRSLQRKKYTISVRNNPGIMNAWDDLFPDYKSCQKVLVDYESGECNRLHAMVAMRYAIKHQTGDDQLDNCKRLVKGWLNSCLCTSELMHLHEIVNMLGRDEELCSALECQYECHIRFNLKYSVDNRDILKDLLERNPDMLSRILKDCPRTWFYDHSVLDVGFGSSKRRTVSGITRAGNESLVDFIEDVLGIELSPKQKVSMDDVFAVGPVLDGFGEYKELSKEAKSHLGLVYNVTCNRKEGYIQSCFSVELTKIPTKNKKGCKTPDFMIRGDSDRPDVLIEVYSGTKGNLLDRCKSALNHGDSKEVGKRYFISQYELDDDTIRVAALVVDDCQIPEKSVIENHLSNIDVSKTAMDYLLI